MHDLPDTKRQADIDLPVNVSVAINSLIKAGFVPQELEETKLLRTNYLLLTVCFSLEGKAQRDIIPPQRHFIHDDMKH